MMKQPTVYTENQTYPNYVYDIQDVRHVACETCLPDRPTWRTMREAGILKQQGMTTIPCQYCGSYDLIADEEEEEHEVGG
jgi:hypothetical protein